MFLAGCHVMSAIPAKVSRTLFVHAVTIGVCVVALCCAASSAAAGQDVSVWTVRPAVGELGELPAGGRVEQEPSVPPPPAAAPTRAHREFIVAPLPLINPTLDNGGALVVGALYPMSDNAPPSATFLMGMATSNHSWAAAVGQTMHLDGDRFRVRAAAVHFDVNVDYFGIGNDAGSADRSIPLNQQGSGGVAELMVRLSGRWYAGARYRLLRTSVQADLSEFQIPVPEDDLQLRTAALGPRFERDTRDSQFYPTRGSLLDVTALFATEALGGRRSYQTYLVSASSFVGLGQRHVLASRINACAASDRTPFYDLCLIGQYQDLRGYQTGQYRDAAMITGQAEYRLELPLRLGLVAFGGVGGVADTFTRLSTSSLLPSAGAGVRVRLTRQNHMNLRVDYAWGDGSQALYVSVGEAF